VIKQTQKLHREVGTKHRRGTPCKFQGGKPNEKADLEHYFEQEVEGTDFSYAIMIHLAMKKRKFHFPTEQYTP